MGIVSINNNLDGIVTLVIVTIAIVINFTLLLFHVDKSPPYPI